MIWTKRIEERLHNGSRKTIDYILRMRDKKPDITVKEYWKYLKDYFVIVPKSSFDVLGVKYTGRKASVAMGLESMCIRKGKVFLGKR